MKLTYEYINQNAIIVNGDFVVMRDGRIIGRSASLHKGSGRMRLRYRNFDITVTWLVFSAFSGVDYDKIRRVNCNDGNSLNVAFKNLHGVLKDKNNET